MVRILTGLLLTLLVLLGSACGSGSNSKRAVECRTRADCDIAELGPCDTVTCESNRCVEDTRPDGLRCDDDDPVTADDACLSGICAGVVKECDDDLGPCLRAMYDPASGECVVEPVEDGASCDDHDACTKRDSCEAGECVGAEPRTCEALDDCHVAGECDPRTGQCSEVAAEDGTACDDGQVCTANDACQAGACAGEAALCEDELSCSVDSCDEQSGGCVSDTTPCICASDQDCDDGNACNGEEYCDASNMRCQAGSSVVCAASTDPCLQNSCVPETGACEPEPVIDGTSCDDASACTSRDTCQNGACVGSQPVVCAALSQCHLPGTCDTATGACSNPERPDDSSCTDGNACTPSDTCQAGACVGAGQVTCAASDQCHDAGVCNPVTGGCTDPPKSNGVKCNDGSPCTSGDACQAGVCKPASQTVCVALDSCHSAGTCDAQTGVCNNPVKANGASCDDGQTCTGPDTCSAGQCGGSDVTCDDGIACTVDSCSEALGGCTVSSTACTCNTSADCNDGNPCNGVETCNTQSMTCQAGSAVDCSGLSDACNVGACSVQTGGCVASPKQNGTTCDDGDLCSQASSCQAGVCQGSSRVTCTALDQCHDAGSCNPATGKCSDPPKANDAGCNDGSACTATDTCQGGVCSGAGAVVCSAIDQCHNAGTCDPSTGICSDPAKKNGTACSDGSLCTQTDTCQGGVCAGASPVTCSPLDQCHLAGSCDPATGTCSDPAKKDDTACADDDLCTQTDTCQAGVCQGSSPLKCTALDQCHVAGACDPASGACSNPNKNDGTVCVDASLCTQTDTCQTGVCTGSNPKSCPASDQCHNAGACDPASGSCSNPSKPDLTPCDDGKACTDSDKCTSGTCAGAGITCNDNVSCTVDSCVEPGGCSFDQSQCDCAKDADCDDGNPCNGAETCNQTSLSCQAGSSVDCSGLDDACNTGKCDRQTGACEKAPKQDGSACNDGSACTGSDACTSGACVGSDPVVCTALDQCHDVGSCAAATGVCSNPAKSDGAGCDDGNLCTQSDSCQGGSCQGASPVTCTASDQCHNAGTCNSKTGVCSNPAKGDGTGCNDGNKCTQTDTCQTGACTGSNPVVCSALDQCHDVGTCAPGTGLCSNPAKSDGAGCDDNDKCTRTDTCQTGTCTGADPVVCTSLGQCYDAGTCDTATGICDNPYAPSGTPCNDTNACTSGEACDSKGTCGGGSTVICTPPANTCKTNTCNITLGCVLGNKPNGTPCDDSSQCTQIDACSKGVCQGGSPRMNINGDWSDDPGAASVGPTSVDTFTDKEGNAVVVGTYHGSIRFNDKDTASYSQLDLPAGQKDGTGIYWAAYREVGDIAGLANIGASMGTLTVEHAAGHSDGSFTLLGTLLGTALFGLPGATTPLDASKGSVVWVAHYKPDGNLGWVVRFIPGTQVPFNANSVAAFDDQSVIAIGTVGGAMSFRDVSGAAFATATGPGVWAVRLSESGVGQWARIVLWPEGKVGAHAVATHEDGAASLTGDFSNRAALTADGKLVLSVNPDEIESGTDVWFLKLDKEGSLNWGGRVGGLDFDQPGDVVRGKDGGALLLANTLGDKPNADDASTSQPLFSTTPSLLQAHFLVLSKDGVLQTAGLMADREKGDTRGYQLKLDAAGYYAVAGTFGGQTSFWSKLGFGSGPPGAAPDLNIASLYQGPSTLYVSRVDAGAFFDWAVQAGGDNSGMGLTPRVALSPWDIVLTGHASHSVTVAGMFHTKAYFGDQVPESLDAVEGTGNPFVLHLNSQAEYDYCP